MPVIKSLARVSILSLCIGLLGSVPASASAGANDPTTSTASKEICDLTSGATVCTSRDGSTYTKINVPLVSGALTALTNPKEFRGVGVAANGGVSVCIDSSTFTDPLTSTNMGSYKITNNSANKIYVPLNSPDEYSKFLHSSFATGTTGGLTNIVMTPCNVPPVPLTADWDGANVMLAPNSLSISTSNQMNGPTSGGLLTDKIMVPEPSASYPGLNQTVTITSGVDTSGASRQSDFSGSAYSGAALTQHLVVTLQGTGPNTAPAYKVQSIKFYYNAQEPTGSVGSGPVKNGKFTSSYMQTSLLPQQLCDVGIPSPLHPAPDASDIFNWTCRGGDGGLTNTAPGGGDTGNITARRVNCGGAILAASANAPTGGLCNGNQISNSTPQSVGVGDPWKWNCYDQTGDAQPCATAHVAASACGSFYNNQSVTTLPNAGTPGICDAGSSVVPGTFQNGTNNASATWKCQGSGGDAPAPCSTYGLPACGGLVNANARDTGNGITYQFPAGTDASGLCLGNPQYSTYQSLPSSPSNYLTYPVWHWTCYNKDDPGRWVSCDAPRTLDAQCGSGGSCNVGTPQQTNITGGYYVDCKGVNGGTDASLCYHSCANNWHWTGSSCAPDVQGQCTSDHNNPCSYGSAINQGHYNGSNGFAGGDKYQWNCRGDNNWDSGGCQEISCDISHHSDGNNCVPNAYWADTGNCLNPNTGVRLVCGATTYGQEEFVCSTGNAGDCSGISKPVQSCGGTVLPACPPCIFGQTELNCTYGGGGKYHEGARPYDYGSPLHYGYCVGDWWGSEGSGYGVNTFPWSMSYPINNTNDVQGSTTRSAGGGFLYLDVCANAGTSFTNLPTGYSFSLILYSMHTSNSAGQQRTVNFMKGYGTTSVNNRWNGDPKGASYFYQYDGGCKIAAGTYVSNSSSSQTKWTSTQMTFTQLNLGNTLPTGICGAPANCGASGPIDVSSAGSCWNGYLSGGVSSTPNQYVDSGAPTTVYNWSCNNSDNSPGPGCQAYQCRVGQFSYSYDSCYDPGDYYCYMYGDCYSCPQSYDECGNSM